VQFLSELKKNKLLEIEGGTCPSTLLLATPMSKQEAFEKRLAHSPLRAAERRLF